MTQVDTGGLGAPDICVLGGGFGGLYTALRLSKLDWGDAPRPRVTLVDQQERFVFLPMLYEVATGAASCWEVAPPFSEVLAGSGVEFVRGSVSGLDAEARMVRVTTGGEGGGEAAERLLPYDACVLALGARATGYARVPGAEAHARQFYTLDDALALRRELQALRLKRRGGLLRVAVVGSGRAFNRGVAQKELDAKGINVVLNTRVASVDEGGLVLQPKAAAWSPSEPATAEPYRLETDLVVWCAGSAPTTIDAPGWPLPLSADGRILTDPTLAVRGAPRLFALGDGAACAPAASGLSPTPSTAQAAMQQADYAAWNVRAALRDEPEKMMSFRYADLGEMLSLGDSAASMSSLGLINLQGPLASLGRRAVYAARMPTSQQAVRAGLSR